MIPMTKDVAALVGEWAEAVENRSLLYEKFSLPKNCWGRDGEKVDDAGRWSVLRVVTGGQNLLKKDETRFRNESRGANVKRDVAQTKLQKASIAGNMSWTAVGDSKYSKPCVEKGQSFLNDVKKSFTGSAVAFEATLGSRMMVNLAGGVVENAGIALDRCFGLPVIPGSAVKGIARAQALWEIRESSEDKKRETLLLAMVIFGYCKKDLDEKGDFGWAGGKNHAQDLAKELKAGDFKGCACFLPAYPTTPPTLLVDMVNPHYSNYYSGNEPFAQDNDSPKPNYFPAVKAGSSFGFAAIVCRLPNLPTLNKGQILDQTKKWLERAVTRKGVGAKTAAGYGWFELGPRVNINVQPGSQNVAHQVNPAEPRSPLDQLVSKFKNLNNKDNFPAALPQMVALVSEADLRSAFEKLVPESERRKLRKNNPYWQSFTSGKAGASGLQILNRLGIKLT